MGNVYTINYICPILLIYQVFWCFLLYGGGSWIEQLLISALSVLCASLDLSVCLHLRLFC